MGPNRPPKSPVYPAVIRVIPASALAPRNSRSGLFRCTAPARPSPATRVVVSTSQGLVAISLPAGSAEGPKMYPSQWEAPRTVLRSEVTLVVVAAFSVKGMNENT